MSIGSPPGSGETQNEQWEKLSREVEELGRSFGITLQLREAERDQFDLDDLDARMPRIKNGIDDAQHRARQLDLPLKGRFTITAHATAEPSEFCYTGYTHDIQYAVLMEVYVEYIHDAFGVLQQKYGMQLRGGSSTPPKSRESALEAEKVLRSLNFFDDALQSVPSDKLRGKKLVCWASSGTPSAKDGLADDEIVFHPASPREMAAEIMKGETEPIGEDEVIENGVEEKAPPPLDELEKNLQEIGTKHGFKLHLDKEDRGIDAAELKQSLPKIDAALGDAVREFGERTVEHDYQYQRMTVRGGDPPLSEDDETGFAYKEGGEAIKHHALCALYRNKIFDAFSPVQHKYGMRLIPAGEFGVEKAQMLLADRMGDIDRAFELLRLEVGSLILRYKYWCCADKKSVETWELYGERGDIGFYFDASAEEIANELKEKIQAKEAQLPPEPETPPPPPLAPPAPPTPPNGLIPVHHFPPHRGFHKERLRREEKEAAAPSKAPPAAPPPPPPSAPPPPLRPEAAKETSQSLEGPLGTLEKKYNVIVLYFSDLTYDTADVIENGIPKMDQAFELVGKDILKKYPYFVVNPDGRSGARSVQRSGVSYEYIGIDYHMDPAAMAESIKRTMREMGKLKEEGSPLDKPVRKLEDKYGVTLSYRSYKTYYDIPDVIQNGLPRIDKAFKLVGKKTLARYPFFILSADRESGLSAQDGLTYIQIDPNFEPEKIAYSIKKTMREMGKLMVEKEKKRAAPEGPPRMRINLLSPEQKEAQEGFARNLMENVRGAGDIIVDKVRSASRRQITLALAGVVALGAIAIEVIKTPEHDTLKTVCILNVVEANQFKVRCLGGKTDQVSRAAVNKGKSTPKELAVDMEVQQGGRIYRGTAMFPRPVDVQTVRENVAKDEVVFKAQKGE